MKQIVIKSERYYTVNVDEKLTDSKELLKCAVDKIDEGIPTDNTPEHEHDWNVSRHTLNEDVNLSYECKEYLYTCNENESNYVSETNKIKALEELLIKQLKINCPDKTDQEIKEQIYSQVLELSRQYNKDADKIIEWLLSSNV